MAKFEKVSRFSEVDINLPLRKTANSAGYDMEVAEDIVIPAYYSLYNKLIDCRFDLEKSIIELNNLAALTKSTKTKPTLVSTGMKCQLEPNTYLELSVRSSCPLKYWLILANGVGRL